MNLEDRGPLRSKARPIGDRRGIGGFYEAIMAMMIVTVGLLLLTCSFTFLAIGNEDGTDLRSVCDDIMSSILEDRTISPAHRMLDKRELGCADWGSIRGDWTGGMAVFLTLPDGTTWMLHQDDMPRGVERGAASEPVNIVEQGGRISAALLTVWVWP